jgi:glycosyltransferase involved in cell wall biosynthesis
MRRLLVIAFHFPPFAGSSGVQRTLRFVQHLPSFGWEPIVLTASRSAYEHTDDALLADIPAGVIVERALAVDASRHLAIGGRYPAFLARPDRWMSWQFDAIRRGLRLCRRWSPHAIWSTYPIATAHLVATGLQRRTGLPWIADFRDPMAQDGYPADGKTWQCFRSIEEKTIRSARKAVFVTPGAARYYQARYLNLEPSRFAVIQNGYDEETFATIERAIDVSVPLNPGKVTLLHSGVVYPSERDPTQLFAALEGLVKRGIVSSDGLCVRFRASGHENMLRDLASLHSLGELVEILPPIPYREAIAEMLRADGLLLLQGVSCNDQIPAKLYEYARAKRPIIGLTDPAGDTALAMREIGIEDFAPLESKEAVTFLIEKILANLLAGVAPLPDPNKVADGSRRGRTQQLSILLNEAVEH